MPKTVEGLLNMLEIGLELNLNFVQITLVQKVIQNYKIDNFEAFVGYSSLGCFYFQTLGYKTCNDQ